MLSLVYRSLFSVPMIHTKKTVVALQYLVALTDSQANDICSTSTQESVEYRNPDIIERRYPSPPIGSDLISISERHVKLT